MKKHVLVDIDIITQYLKSGQGILPKAYEQFDMQISAATYTELLASGTFDDAELEKEVLDFVKKYFTVIDFDSAVALEAARVMRQYGLNFGTSIVAGTARAKGLDLLTEKTKDFEKVEGVNVMKLG